MSAQAPAAFDVQRIRQDFPILAERTHGRPLTFLDSAASAQKPLQVLDAVRAFESTSYANVHRGSYDLSQRATRAYEDAREAVRSFIGAADSREVIFTSGTTGAINLVAATFGRVAVGPGDEIVVTAMEHHSNIVPWQLLAESRGAALRVIPISEAGELDLEAAAGIINPRTRIVAFGHVSNALGTVNPVARLVALARAAGAATLVDGAQAAPHLKINVQALGCDFYAFSGHKIFGPTGTGVLYGRLDLLKAMPPWQGGGDMIETVRFEGSTWAEPPSRFEAGTPNITGAVGLGAAIAYLEGLDWPGVEAHEADLLAYATQAVGAIEGVRLVGTAAEKVGVLSFVVQGIHPHDIGMILDQEGVAVRIGHHCAQPLMRRLGVEATVRASFAFYNTRDDVDRLVAALRTAVNILS